MPSRKKDRGKQRKAAKQSSNGLAGIASPMAPEIKEFMAQGGRVDWGRDNGTSRISHPCLKHIKRGNGSDTARAVRDFDRGLLNGEERQELAVNYVFNFAQDMREGGCHGTEVIMRNLADPHIGPRMGDELRKADIHLSLLRFLNQTHTPVSSVLGREVDAGGSTMLPFFWVSILGLLAKDARDSSRLKVARDIGPFVMRMIDDKRELFQSIAVWHTCISPFFDLVRGLMMSRDGFLAMISYEGFLPFVAQASCWSQSRVDIAAEYASLRQPLSATSHEAQKILALAIAYLNVQYDAVQEDVMRGALDQIACSRLLSNDTNCNDSTIAGLVRMMNEKGDKTDHEHLFGSILGPLLLKHGYVDDQAIAELIEYGRGNSSIEAVETVLYLMLALLARDLDYDHIQLIDSRYASAVRHGLLEFCVNALIADGNGSGIEEEFYCISYGLCLMAMHSKTSRALRERKEDILAALDELRKKCASQFDKICSLIDEAINMSAPAVCCNCLQEVDRRELLYCKRCGVECYCSPACQSESYELGHDEQCKKEVDFVDTLRGKGIRETELKRMAVLSSNLMMNGCRLVRSMAEECLNEEQQWKEVSIYFVNNPPDVRKIGNDEGYCAGGIKCAFHSRVRYGFADRVGLNGIVLHKSIPRRWLAQSGPGASTDQQN